MKLLNMSCPNCGSKLSFDKESGECTCSSCGGKFLLDNESTTQHVEFDNAEDAGYEFEKGRQKAQAEARRLNGYSNSGSASTKKTNNKSKKNNLIWWIIGWICFFPIPLTIIVYRSNKLSQKAKVIILSVVWGYIAIATLISSCNKATHPQDSIAETSVNNITIESDVVSDTNNETYNNVIAIESLSLANSSIELSLGETIQLDVNIVPANAVDGSLSWSSSDPGVATVDDTGNVTAVGAGEAIITATSSNGVNAECNVSVDASRRNMHLSYSSVRDDDNNIGDEWSFVREINGERVVQGDYTVSIGDTLFIYVRYSEDDDNPDVGEASVNHTVTEDDFENGFSEVLELNVTENGGRNSGQSAHFVVTFVFEA